MPCIVMFTILTVVTSVRSLPILAAGGEQRFRPLHGARALRGDFEGRREYSLNSENISNSTWDHCVQDWAKEWALGYVNSAS